VAGTLNSHGYWSIKIAGKPHKAHRLAWLYVHGEWPPEDVDHINRARDDNRIVNLRLASRSENIQNSSLRLDNSSGHKGVCWVECRQKWIAQIKHQSRCKHLGYFDDINDAVAARKSAEAEMHPFAAQ
jgi:hypothetical protein